MGTWALVSFKAEKTDGENTHPFGSEPEGFLIYTEDGIVSAQLMKPCRSAFHSGDWERGTPEEYQRAGSGYIAYCGRYEIDEGMGTVIHIPSVALRPNLIGARQLRVIELCDDRLTLRSQAIQLEDGFCITNRLEWKRFAPSGKS
jgi:hypothetical protein